MRMKHKVSISVKDGNTADNRLLSGANIRLPAKIIRWLFGDFTNIYLLKPGQSIESVEIHETKQEE